MTSIALTEDDTLLSSYNYHLPENLIAQQPCTRGASRLLVVDKHQPDPEHVQFECLPQHLPQGALLVANNSRVVPVRLLGTRPSGGRMEFLLLTPLPLVEACKKLDVARAQSSVCYSAEAEALLRPSKNMRPGDVLEFGFSRDGESLLGEDSAPQGCGALRVEVLAKGEFGKHTVRLWWQNSLEEMFVKCGHLPLPPYIRRQDTAEDAASYQTVYARADKAGSAAAPTAGLHFTEAMRQGLTAQGFQWAEVTLHVGYGTFSPVRCSDIRQHHMHGEFIEVSETTAAMVQAAKEEGRPVVAVGTTACRTLEGVANLCGGKVAAYAGWTNIFIWPGYEFKVVDAMITNFHLPESTLLMLVSALVGRERMLRTYREAVEHNYRFFSYGDAMLLK